MSSTFCGTRWIVAKYASGPHFLERTHQYTIDDSASSTYTGKLCGCADVYEDMREAQSMSEKMNRENPSGYYGVKSVFMEIPST